MKPSHRNAPVILVLVLALLSALPVAAQTWYESYHLAEEALAKEKWSEAVRHLNTALATKPDSGANVRTYGMRFVDYFPYFKLGVAYYHLGQPDAALQAFDTELGQGAIDSSPGDEAELQSYRDRIGDERSAREVDRNRRLRQVVSENLSAAARFEAAGRPEDALAALGRVLAVEPDHAAALSRQARLRVALSEARRRSELEQKLAALVARGRDELARGDYRHAAASFGEAQQLLASEETGSLLAQAQEGLAAELAVAEDAEARRRLVVGSLRRAADHERRGELEEALVELQSVLAIEPRNEAALSLQRRVIEQQAVAEGAGRAAASVEALLSEAEGHYLEGDYEGCLRAANQVLAFEPAHPQALRQIAQAYTRLGDRLLSGDDAPPVIVLDLEPGVGGVGASVVRAAQYELTGSVFDSSPVSVVARAGGELLAGLELSRRELRGLWVTEFRVAWRLAPGTTVFEVEATDDEGNSARVEQAIEYAVPFTRSWWLAASLAGLVGLALAGFAAVRIRRRRRLLRVRFNPYVAGAPILEQERFFGRQQLLDYVLRRICNNSVMLYGERRIGKTSFQHQLKRCLATLDDPHHEFYPVFVDLQGIPEERFFATLASEVFHELGPKLNGLQPNSAIGGADYGYREFVRDVQSLLAALQERASKKIKLVLLIDEVDELNHYDPRINQRLRSLFMRAFAERLVAVVSGVAIKKQWEREGSPWYNFFQEIEVKPLDLGEARSLIEAPVSGVFGFEAGAADEIIGRTHSKPYLIQRLCSGLVDRMHEERRRTITLDDVRAACSAEGL